MNKYTRKTSKQNNLLLDTMPNNVRQLSCEKYVNASYRLDSVTLRDTSGVCIFCFPFLRLKFAVDTGNTFGIAPTNYA